MASIYDAFTHLYENRDDGGDGTFVVHGRVVKVHKAIVAARSDVIKGMFFSIFDPADGRHLINDEKITADDFEEFVQFIYRDICDIRIDNVGALLHLSVMYFVPLLKEQCIDFVRLEYYHFEDCMQLYQNALLYELECPEMIQIAIDNLQHHAFQNHEVSVDIVEEIVKRRTRNQNIHDEDTIMKRIYEWARAECGRRGVPAEKEGIKRLLSPMMKHMNLKEVSYLTWAQIICPNELAPLEECVKHLAKYATKTCDIAEKLAPGGRLSGLNV